VNLPHILIEASANYYFSIL